VKSHALNYDEILKVAVLCFCDDLDAASISIVDRMLENSANKSNNSHVAC